MFFKYNTVSGPTLSSGTYTFTVSGAEKVLAVVTSFDDPFTASTVYASSAAITGATVVVTIKKQSIAGAWSNAGNSDITGNLTIIAACE